MADKVSLALDGKITLFFHLVKERLEENASCQISCQVNPKSSIRRVFQLSELSQNKFVDLLLERLQVVLQREYKAGFIPRTIAL